MRISELNYYPVKSCRGIGLKRAVLNRCGIRNDRRWMVVDPGGRFLTQREFPAMARIVPEVTETRLVLRRTGAGDLVLPLAPPPEAPLTVQVWRDACLARDYGPAAADWLEAALGTPCRLVTMDDSFTRLVDSAYGRPGDEVGFADGFPLLLTSASSLADLNRRLDAPVPMARFRPNLVVEGAEAFAEDEWDRISVPSRGVTFRVVKPCARCMVTTVDPVFGEKTGPEPLATLTTFRHWNDERRERGVMFGQNLIHDWTGAPLSIEVGDEVDVVA